MTAVVWGLLRPKVSLLALSEVPVEARMGHDVAEDLKALADELSALSNVRVQHVEVAHVLVADVARSGPTGYDL